MNEHDQNILDVMKAISTMKNNPWMEEAAYYDETEDLRKEAKSATKSAARLEGMLERLMKHLRSTGEDVLIVLKDEELHKWWQEKLIVILKEEAKQAAMEKAMAALSEEERRALGLKF